MIKKGQLIKFLEDHGYSHNEIYKSTGRATFDSIYGHIAILRDLNVMLCDESNFWLCRLEHTVNDIVIHSEFRLVDEGKIQYDKFDKSKSAMCDAILKLDFSTTSIKKALQEVKQWPEWKRNLSGIESDYTIHKPIRKEKRIK